MGLKRLLKDGFGLHKNIDEFMIFKEIPATIGRIIILGFMILFPARFVIAFIIAAISSLFYVFFRFDKKM